MRQTKFQLLLSEREREALLRLAHYNGISAAGVLRQLLLNASQARAREPTPRFGSVDGGVVRSTSTMPDTSMGTEGCTANSVGKGET